MGALMRGDSGSYGIAGVALQPKSPFQRNDCLFCDGFAEFEAVYGVAVIRCCRREECQQAAASLAHDTGKSSPSAA